MSALFERGDRVHSQEVGRRKAFDGVVVGPYYRSGQWLVKDAEGRGWVRDSDEIVRLPAERDDAA